MILQVRNHSGMQWAIQGPGKFSPCGRTVQELPAGAYSCLVDYCGNTHFEQRDLQVDDLIDFPDSMAAHVLDEVNRFWNQGDRFARFGFLHRRGYLFYGKQGGGKSSLIHMIVSRIIDAGHVAFFCQNPNAFIRCMEQFRLVEPDRPIVCIFEDIDAIIEQYTDSELLQWLDGNHQVSKAINLASTNYPEKLDRRITSRPRRFDRILRIDSPDARLREAYFARKLADQSLTERAQWVEATAGLPFAALAELIISVCCLGNPFDDAIAQLRELDSHRPSSAEFTEEAEAEEEAEVTA